MVSLRKITMVERCLIAASLAALVCHPSSTIKCFKPKPKDPSPQKGSKRHAVILKDLPEKPKPYPKAAAAGETEETGKADSSSASKLKKKTQRKVSKQKSFDKVSELVSGDPSIGVVETILRSDWGSEGGLEIEKVLRVNHNLDSLHTFEEYRKVVKLKYEKARIRKSMERLVVDGNELLQFHSAEITCSLGINGVSRTCKKQCCQVCRLIDSKFSGKGRERIFFDSSRKAHEKVRKQCDGKGECGRKAFVICRVIAGKIAHSDGYGDVVGNEDGGFDSSMEWGEQFSDSRELVVANSEAVLPCFVILYNVKNKKVVA